MFTISTRVSRTISFPSPLLRLMPVSFATILGENKTNGELAASPDSVPNTLGILTRHPIFPATQSRQFAGQVINYNPLLKRDSWHT